MRTLLLLLLSSFSQVWALCHPQANWSRPQFVLGYGSLIYQDSKAKTLAQSGPNYPVIIKGYQRSWLVRGHFLSKPTTFLGVEPKSDAWMNAVIFQIFDQTDLAHLDKREQGYCRYQVSAQEIQYLHGKGSKEGQYWIYIPQNNIKHHANQNYPMSEYYANIFLSGCLNMERGFHLPGFLRQCFITTQAWPKHHDAYYPEDALPVSRQLFSELYQALSGHTRHRVGFLLKPNTCHHKTNANTH